MEIIAGTKEFRIGNPSAAAIGKFDGIHIGHRKLLQEITSRKREGLKACVFTFDPPPSVFLGFTDGRELTTREEKRLLFAEAGVDILVEYPMDRQTADMSPEAFIEDILAYRIMARFIAAGTDVSYGIGGKGDAALLEKLSAVHQYTLELIDKVCLDDKEVSSTLVREAIDAGRMEEAARMLGAPYSILGTVIQVIRPEGTPAISAVSLLPGPTKLLPPNGLYSSKVTINGSTYKGITRIGSQPSLSPEPQTPCIETHITNLDKEIPGPEIKVSLLSPSEELLPAPGTFL